jgi:hypothetical protein
MSHAGLNKEDLIMQEDFHYAGTYVLARLAGFDGDKALKIATCAQYVDDAVFDGKVIDLETGEAYYCIRSAHCNEDLVMDVETIEDQKYNHQVWSCFHFLPGNGGQSSDALLEMDLGEKLICKPNSYVAQEMVNECIKSREAENALERLGVTMHVYADTWAHQDFAGVRDKKLNHVEAISALGIDDSILNIGDRLLIPSLGHMQAWKHPDLPFLSWQMRKGDKAILRNNTSAFLDAAYNMVVAMQRFINPSKADLGLSEQDQEQLKLLMERAVSQNADERINEWYSAITRGDFSFGAEEIPVYNKNMYNVREWADVADFIEWKKFHDALHDHRNFLIETLLPKYGIVF